MSSLDRDKPVCVTGASGYIAVFVVRDLLQRGWIVHGTVRDVDNEAKVAPLKALPGAADQLRLFAADLKTGGFEAALEGCTACVHTACPIEIPLDGKVQFHSMEELEEQQMKPALAGTTSVLEACAAMGVQRVVLTSSLAAMAGVPPPGHPCLDESCWSDEAFLKENVLKTVPFAYRLAKTVQEREAMRLAKEHSLDLRSINPSLVIGPMLTNHLNFSQEVILNVLRGKGSPFQPQSRTEGKVQNGCLTCVDVREVSQAHVLALEDDSASGRYLLNSFTSHYDDIVRIAHEKFPMLQSRLPPLEGIDGDDASDYEKKVAPKFNNTKCRELGVSEVPLASSITETIEALGGMGLLDLTPLGEEQTKRRAAEPAVPREAKRPKLGPRALKAWAQAKTRHASRFSVTKEEENAGMLVRGIQRVLRDSSKGSLPVKELEKAFEAYWNVPLNLTYNTGETDLKAFCKKFPEQVVVDGLSVKLPKV